MSGPHCICSCLRRHTRTCACSLPARRGFLRAAQAVALACGAPALLGGCERLHGEPPGASGVRVLEARETRFGRLAVVERGRKRYLAYGRGFDTRFMYESVLDLDRPHELAAPYTRLMMLAVVYAEPYARMVQIGTGAGNMTGYALRTFASVEVDAIDIDPHAMQLGAKYFGLAPHPRLRLHVADGRAWLAARDDRFDVVMLDAYDDESIPPTLAGADFYALVASRLAAGGVAMQNVYLPKVDAPRLLAALRESFAQVDIYRVDDSVVLAAYRGAARSADRLAARARALDDALHPAHSLAELLRHRVAAL
jgi:spermidine synthase